MNYFKLLTIILGLSFVQNNFAQSIVRSNLSTFGSQFTNGDYTISQTVGQSSNTSVLVNGKTTFRQGFQQPTKSIASVDKNELLNFSLYPSPNNGFFSINIETLKNEAFEFEIYNVLGAKIFKDVAFSQVKKDVNISNLSSGMYLLRIIEKNRSLGEIKFVIY